MTKRLKTVGKLQPKKILKYEAEKHMPKPRQSQTSCDSPTSSTTTTSSSSSSTSSETFQCEEENAINLLDNLFDFSDESAVEEDIEHTLESELLKSPAESLRFFESFAELPDINEISEDVSVGSVEPIKMVKEVVTDDSAIDVGHFVEPLTGVDFVERLGSSDTDFNQVESTSTSEEQRSYPSEASDLFLTDHVSDLNAGDSQTLVSVKKVQSEEMLEAFLELSVPPINKALDEIDIKASTQQQANERIRQQTLELIDDLIERAVKKAKFPRLEADLDKRKLLAEIVSLHQKSQEEQNISKFLHRKMVDFFRRRKMFSQITEEAALSLPKAKQKYSSALKRLDEVLAKNTNVQTSSANVSTKLEEELKVYKQQVQGSIFVFEELIRKTLCRDDRPYLNSEIHGLLKRMTNYRKEISEVRLRMIILQHTHAELLNKLNHLKDLGNGICFEDIHHKQTENQTLGQRIEERNADLEKFYRRFCRKLHSLAHIREKQNSLKVDVQNQNSALAELQSKCSCLRNNVFRLKQNRCEIRKKIKALSFQNGLLDKPALMYDYDRTVELLKEQRETVHNLRVNLRTTQQKIESLERLFHKDNCLLSLK